MLTCLTCHKQQSSPQTFRQQNCVEPILTATKVLQTHELISTSQGMRPALGLRCCKASNMPHAAFKSEMLALPSLSFDAHCSVTAHHFNAPPGKADSFLWGKRRSDLPWFLYQTKPCNIAMCWQSRNQLLYSLRIYLGIIFQTKKT